jgi:single-stranded-DNA-specific exonuclease
MITRPINQNLLNNYSDDIKNFLKSIYAARNILESDLDLGISNLLTPDFNDLPQALEILTTALLKQQKVIIIADFDADGATSCALAIKALKSFGLENIDFIVPNRFIDGYGLNPNIAKKAKNKDADILITVDNGISSHTGCKKAKELGMQVIITDHHLPSEELPNADAIINPNLKNCNFKSKNLAGVGVVFYLLSALKTHLVQLDYFRNNNITPPNMKNLLDLVALGTIADVVKLDRNNQILVKEGLKIINSGRCCYGILALIDIAKKSYKTIKSSDLAFSIAPKINASGRMDDISRGISCLLSIDQSDAYKYALELDEFNNIRKQTQEQMSTDADKILQNIDTKNKFSICLYDENWHEGVVGIVAGKCKEKYNAISIIFANSGEFLKGSARSIEGIHIKDLLDLIDNQYPNLIEKFGGHAMAAGLNLKPENFAKFAEVLELMTKEYLNNELPSAEILTDGKLVEDDITLENALLLDEHIWGSGNPEPIFTGNFEIVQQKVVGEKHLKLRLKLETKVFDAIAFWQEPIASKHITMAYNLNINHYNSQQYLQLISREITSK